MIFIRYHWYFPGQNDPYYRYNISENMARNNYYSNNYSPHFFIDGSIDAGSNRFAWRNMLNDEAEVESPLVVGIRGTYDSDALAGEITVTVFAEMDPELSNLKLRVALIENDIIWQAPNGATLHDQTFRDMLPNTAGIGIALQEGDTVVETLEFTTPDPLVPENCMLVAFVQSDQNRRILQGARISIPDLMQTSVDDDIYVPETFTLSQNYPNPFNASTMIDFYTEGGMTRLDVFDLTGAKVKTLVNGELEAGQHSFVWNGSNDQGNILASGVYFYKLNTAEGQEVKRMTLLK